MALALSAGVRQHPRRDPPTGIEARVVNREKTVAYGHAERTLAAIRHLETETMELLRGLAQLDSEQRQWLQAVGQAHNTRTLPEQDVAGVSAGTSSSRRRRGDDVRVDNHETA